MDPNTATLQTPKPEVNPKLRAILDQIDEVLAGPDAELSGQLWDVLSALRGPDEGTAGVEDDAAYARVRLKRATTNHVRIAAFPKMAKVWRSDQHVSDSAASRVDLTTMPIIANQMFEHFRAHVIKAMRCLRLAE